MLGQDKIMTAHVQCRKLEEGTKPVRGEVVLPRPVSAEGNESTVLVFATVSCMAWRNFFFPSSIRV